MKILLNLRNLCVLFTMAAFLQIGHAQYETHHKAFTTQAVQERFTNNRTGHGGNDGLLIGLRNSSRGAYIQLLEKWPLLFSTSGQERMRITPDGKVGIGTSNPTRELDVRGRVRVRNLPTGAYQLVTAASDGTLNRLRFPGNPNFVLRANGTFGPVPSDADWFKALTTDPPFSLNDNIYTLGRVGVGTNNPDRDLDVRGNARISNMPLGPGIQLVTASPDGTLRRNLYPNDPNLVLRGDGVFGPVPGDNWGTQTAATDATINGDGASGNELSVNISGDANNELTLGTDGALYAPSDPDNDPANELQTLSRTGNDVTLSNGGGTASIEDDDSDPTNELNTSLQLNNTTLELTDAGGTLNVDLSALAGEDKDWFKVGTTNAPNDITDNIFKLGNVSIGTSNPNPNVRLEVVGGNINLHTASSVLHINHANNRFGYGTASPTIDHEFRFTSAGGNSAGISTKFQMLNNSGTSIFRVNPDGWMQAGDFAGNSYHGHYFGFNQTSGIHLTKIHGNSTHIEDNIFTIQGQLHPIQSGVYGGVLRLRDGIVANEKIRLAALPVNSYINTGGNFGVGTAAPTNKLDVDSGSSGVSGLTLSGLNSNPTGKVLSVVDGTGEVILVDGQGGDADPQNELQDLDLNGNTLSLTDDPTPVDLSPYLDNTDEQTLSLSGSDLSISGGNTVNLGGIGLSACPSLSAADNNFLTKWSDANLKEICRSSIFENNAGFVRIGDDGTGNIGLGAARLTVNADPSNAIRAAISFSVQNGARRFIFGFDGNNDIAIRNAHTGNSPFIINKNNDWVSFNTEYFTIQKDNPSHIYFRLNNTNALGTDWFFRSTATSFSGGIEEGSLTIDPDGAVDAIQRFVLTPEMKVGIGQGFPDARLHVTGLPQTSYAAKFENNSAYNLLSIQNDGVVTSGELTGTTGHFYSANEGGGFVTRGKNFGIVKESGINGSIRSTNDILMYEVHGSDVYQHASKELIVSANATRFDVYSDLKVKPVSQGGTGRLCVNCNTIDDLSTTAAASIVGDAVISGNVGIGTGTPTNKLDVNPGSLGVSGLTLSGLNSNPTGKVLSVVDGTGEVILVDGQGDGNGIYDGSGSLSGSTTVSMLTNSLSFLNGNISMGASPHSDMQLLVAPDGTEAKAGLRVDATQVNPGYTQFDVINNSLVGTGNAAHLISVKDNRIGFGSTPLGHFFSHFLIPDNNDVVAGVRVDANGNIPFGNSIFDVVAGSHEPHTHIFRVNGDDTGNGDYRVGIMESTPNYTLDVNGDINASGLIYSSDAMIHMSDQRFKKDIQPLEDMASKMQQVEGVSYYFKTEKFEDRNFKETKDIGFIAQEMEKVFPEVVYEDAEGYKGIDYAKLTPVLWEAVKQLENENTQIRQEMEELKGIVKQFAAKFEQTDKIVNRTRVNLGGAQSVILDQNAPNPFKERTAIGYVVPEKVENAQIFIFDLNGQIMKKVPLQAGEGVLEVFASNLSSGMYSYSLVIDGKVMDTKKMVVSK